jgi:hypothetical protein
MGDGIKAWAEEAKEEAFQNKIAIVASKKPEDILEAVEKALDSLWYIEPRITLNRNDWRHFETAINNLKLIIKKES